MGTLVNQAGRPFLTEARRQQLGKCQYFSFFGFVDFGQLGRSCSDLFGYLKKSKTHSQGIQNRSNSKLRRESRGGGVLAAKIQTFLQNFCNFLLVLFFYPSSWLVFVIYDVFFYNYARLELYID